MNLEQLISSYVCPVEAVEIIRNTNIALLVGISGAGKDTIKRALLKQPEFGDVVSHTTRQPRQNQGVPEQDGVDYHFITIEKAKAMLEAGEFIEAKFVHGTVYGTTIAAVNRAGEHGIAMTDVDVQGVEEYKEASNKVVAIFIVPPNYQTWIERLRSRYATEEEFAGEWPRRRESAIQELTRALELPYYHFVINDELDRAVRVTSDIAQRTYSEDVFTRKDDEARLVARDILRQIKEV